MRTVDTVRALRDEIGAWRKDGTRVALVPTMGALHAGHLALVARHEGLSDRVVVSIFVNPKQFAPHEDFDCYPRDIQSDSAKLAKHAPADICLCQKVPSFLPSGLRDRVEVSGPSAGLETDFRPHFLSRCCNGRHQIANSLDA